MHTKRAGLAAAALSLSALLACEAAPKDTQDTDCDDGYTCSASLEVTVADAGAEFQVVMYGSGFNTLTVYCPDNVAAGGSGQNLTVTCQDGGFLLTADEYAFPETFTASIDEGPEQEYTATFSAESDLCGIACNDGALSL